MCRDVHGVSVKQAALSWMALNFLGVAHIQALGKHSFTCPPRALWMGVKCCPVNDSPGYLNSLDFSEGLLHFQ